MHAAARVHAGAHMACGVSLATAHSHPSLCQSGQSCSCTDCWPKSSLEMFTKDMSAVKRSMTCIIPTPYASRMRPPRWLSEPPQRRSFCDQIWAHDGHTNDQHYTSPLWPSHEPVLQHSGACVRTLAPASTPAVPSAEAASPWHAWMTMPARHSPCALHIPVPQLGRYAEALGFHGSTLPVRPASEAQGNPGRGGLAVAASAM